ncbi:hypothetical protein [Arthrobacter sp. LAR12-1-1.1]|uniref:hypothetical protein n=1 Tax=Arthrobacter sp. LAR12-1-1.1 TaxID=3135215 RepID=UPI00343785D6
MNQRRVDETFSVNETVSPARAKPTRLWLAAGALAGASLLGGVTVAPAGMLALPGSPQSTSQQTGTQPFGPASYKAEDTLAAFGRITYDYEPFRSPAALAAASQVIVRGAVVGVRKGRVGTGIHSIVLILRADTAIKGGLPQGSDGNVYLELNGARSSDPLYFLKAFPKGAAAVAYMVPAGDGTPREGTDVTVENPMAGRPDGQALFMAPPQGLVLQAGDHDVVWPLIGERAPGKIVDALPGGNLIRG